MKLRLLASLIFACILSTGLYAQDPSNIQQPTSINEDGSDPDSSAILDVQSDSLGFLAPRMTTAQRNAISNPTDGLLVYDNSTGSFWFHEGSNWIELASTAIHDKDGDTKVDVEETPDEDVIHLDAGGIGVMELSSTQIGMPTPDPLSQVNIASVAGLPNTLQVSDPGGAPLMWVSDALGAGAGIMAINPSIPAPGPPAHLWIAGGPLPEMIHVDDAGGVPIMLMVPVAPGIGDLIITGTLVKGALAFKIDHPVDPENKFLMHTAIESPDMMNVYNGNITTDENGLATVILEDYFEALNRDFRYQLTVMGTFAQAIIKEEVIDNKFVIQTNEPNVKVSWQITGIRHDPYADGHRTPHVLDKTPEEKGKYLHAHYYGQPIEKQLGRTARN